ncbi:MAG TPA: branched-chain amino acid ABC transporter permease, partial [Candidatus Eisenbacteria bacterium]|nr:branched-chain amino acid ABC transporter permease [Candidatus Eisenbacteria bacterium]
MSAQAPAPRRRLRADAATTLKWAAIALLVVAMFAVPPLYGQYLPQRVSNYLIFGLPALAVGLIAGHARLLNVGVGATFGVAAYAVVILTRHGMLNPFVLMLAGLAAGLLVSVLFAVYAVVATGLEYLLLTLLTTAAFSAVPLLATSVTGGENGLSIAPGGAVVVSFGLDPIQGSGFYWLLCSITVFWCVVSWYLLSSRAGRAMVAIGRNPVRAAAMGYSVHAYQVAVTLYSGLIAATGGWLYAIANTFVSLDLLGLTNSVNAVLYSLIGGVETIIGPLLGTAGLRFLSEFTGMQSTQSQLYVGMALLVVVYLLPAGV